MYGVFGWITDSTHGMLFVTDLWEDAFSVWDKNDKATCIVDLETGEVLWD